MLNFRGVLLINIILILTWPPFLHLRNNERPEAAKLMGAGKEVSKETALEARIAPDFFGCERIELFGVEFT